MPSVSITVPCYNEEEALPYLYNELTAVIDEKLSSYAFELIFVDDGSTDKTLKVLKDMSKSDERVKYLSFSRNFGKEAAIYAGLEASSGDYVVLMDADKQDPPALLPEMLRIVTEEDYDSVATRRVNRKGEPAIRSFFARCFYRLMNRMSKTEVVDGARDYRVMNRQFVNALLSMKEYNRFSKGLFGWVGFKTKWIEYENTERVAGESKWSFWKLLCYSLDGIIAFSTAPLSFAMFLGLACCLVGLVAICVIVIRTLAFGDPVAGWPSTICIILFIGGLQLLCLGILGGYLARTYLEGKDRPLYLCRESNLKE